MCGYVNEVLRVRFAARGMTVGLRGEEGKGRAAPLRFFVAGTRQQEEGEGDHEGRPYGIVVGVIVGDGDEISRLRRVWDDSWGRWVLGGVRG